MKTVCVQCRARKVRCDGVSPRCATCSRLRLTCSFSCRAESVASLAAGASLDLPPKYRSSVACLQCRSRKMRCSGETPQCAACVHRAQPCSYATVRGTVLSTVRSATIRGRRPAAASRRRWHPEHQEQEHLTQQAHAGSDDTDQSLLLTPHGPGRDAASLAAPGMPSDGSSGLETDEQTVADLVDRYFRYLHALPAYGFLHQSTVSQRCRENTIHPALKAALCAITALFVGSHADSRDAWACASERLIFDGIDRPSIFHLQALLLVIRYRAESGHFSRAFMLAGLAGRLAAALRLNYEHPDLGSVAQEVRRRTFWSLYFLEEVFSCALPEFELCRPDIIYLQLPREDVDFADETAASTGFLQPGLGLEPATIGPRGLFVKLALVRRNIMKFNRQIYGKEMSLTDLFTALDQLQNSLRRLGDQMSPQDRYPPAEPDTFHWSPQYAMLHMSYYQCHCDLYRSFLRGHPDTATQGCIDEIKPADVASMAGRSLQNARQVLCVLADYDQYADPCQPLDWDAAVCAYNATRFLLFGSTHDKAGRRSTANAAAVHIAINKAQDVLDALARRFSFSAAVQPMRDDLTRLVTRYRSLLLRSSAAPDSESVYDAHRGLQAPPGVTKSAGSRQFLAIHSLLLRSDFIDDSREAVTTEEQQQQQQQQQQHHTARETAAVVPGGGRPGREEEEEEVTDDHALPATVVCWQQPPAAREDQADQPMPPPLNDIAAAGGDQDCYWEGGGFSELSTFDFPPLLNGLMGDGFGFDFGLWPDMLGPYGTVLPRPQGMGIGELDEQHMY